LHVCSLLLKNKPFSGGLCFTHTVKTTIHGVIHICEQPSVMIDCADMLQEEYLILSEHLGGWMSILIEDFGSPHYARRETFEGLQFQFVYPGDQIHVMQSRVSTIETVN
jgi:hypothetical protein